MYTEDYFKTYKHLAGCVVVNSNKELWICSQTVMRLPYWFKFKSFVDSLKFYIDDDTLGTYEDYMNAHYPEYKHWWEIK